MKSKLLWLSAAVVLSLLLIAIINPRSEFRADGLWSNPEDGAYDLAFLELSERGNLFHRERLFELVEHVEQQSKTLMIVFVHGWKHNARESDGNVQSIRRLLHNLSTVRGLGGNRLLGVYIGWPGRSAPPILNSLTFWSRKAVAEEVGKGGVSEILLRLEQAAKYGDPVKSRNLSVFVGHSFGGAIVLAALHEIMLEKVISAKPVTRCNGDSAGDQCDANCVQTDPFGHAVVLINPAIEANQILQLKESVAERCFPPEQDKLLHVISTKADIPNHYLFPFGQSVRMIGWNEQDALARNFRGQDVQFSEHELDTTTIGNFSQFWTGRLHNDGEENWRYCSFAGDSSKPCNEADTEIPSNLMPTRANEPLAFTYTDADFMTGHNDVFNAQMAAFLSAITIESVQRKLPPSDSSMNVESNHCMISFELGGCFETLYAEFKKRF